MYPAPRRADEQEYEPIRKRNNNDMKDFKNKVVVVTGASSGIGEALAREFAAQGARVVLGARSVQKLQLIAGDIRSKGGQAAYCAVDVTRPEECRGSWS